MVFTHLLQITFAVFTFTNYYLSDSLVTALEFIASFIASAVLNALSTSCETAFRTAIVTTSDMPTPPTKYNPFFIGLVV